MSKNVVYKIIDNFLTKSYHKEILDTLSDANFPWYYNDNISKRDLNGGSPYESGFSHIFVNRFSGGQRDTFYATFMKPMFHQIMDCVGADSIVRGRADMTMATPNNYEHAPHVDFSFKNIATVFYVNNSDGDTVFYENKKHLEGDVFNRKDLKIIDRVSPKPNRLVIFDGHSPHTGCSPKKYKNRILINSNYEKNCKV
jgi:hypothetical protein